MSKPVPRKLFRVYHATGHVLVIARHGKGAKMIAREHGYQPRPEKSGAVEIAIPATAAFQEAINAKAKE